VPYAMNRDAVTTHGSPAEGRVVAIGVDVVDTDEVRAAVRDCDEVYLAGTFSSAELDECFSRTDPAAHLAALLAAKGAVIKAIAPTGPPPPMTSIEIGPTPWGRWAVSLSGRAAQFADWRGIDDFALALGREDDVTTATVVAVQSPRAPD